MRRDPERWKARDPRTGPTALADEALHAVRGGLSFAAAFDPLSDGDAALATQSRGRYQLRLAEARTLLAK
jgi:hypothetical protein